MCDEFGPEVSSGLLPKGTFPVGWHPHMGMDIMTYLREGTGRHADSLGNVGDFASPGFQWISVGSGIEHAEGGGTPAGETMHGFQIWINVPARHKLDDPAYGTANPESIPRIDLGSTVGHGLLLAGPHGGAVGPFQTKQSVQILDLELVSGADLAHQLPDGMDTCILYCYRGAATVNGAQALSTKEAARLDASSSAARSLSLTVAAEGGPCGVLLFAGKRINEPIAWRGPFVMNTQKEITDAFAAYQNGKFPAKRVPWDYRAGETGPP
jgi:hypothetical protein